VAMDAAISVAGLTKRYGGRTVVDGVTFEVRQGESFGILGPNGAGKTTTLEMIEGLRRPDGGEITLLGEPVWPDPRRIQARIGVQLQSTSLFDMLTARELLELFARFYLRPDAVERARLTLELVGLESKADDYAKRLSGGQQQRLAIALALVHDPDIVFLDEPTTGLDPQARRNLWEVIRSINADQGKTVVLTTHYLEEAEQLCQRVAIMDESRIVALDTPAGLIASGSPFELTRAAGRATIRLVVTEPFPPGAPASLQAELGDPTEVHPVNEHSLLITGPADATTLAKVSAWCDRNGVLPESLNLGQRTLEDVFLQITGRELNHDVDEMSPSR